MLDAAASVVTVGIPRLGLVTLRRPRVLDAARLVSAAADPGPDRLAPLAVGAAALALAIEPTSTTWRPSSTLRDHGGQVVVWGEVVFDDLVRERVLADDYAGTARVVGELGAQIVEWVSTSFAVSSARAEEALGPFEPTPGPAGTP